MIDIEKVREALVTVAYADLGDNGICVSDYHEEELNEIGNALTELEELKRDVKRFMELIPKVKFRPLQDEVYSLQQKLLKVGKEE